MKYYKFSMNLILFNVLCSIIFVVFYVFICFLGYASCIDLRLFVLYFLWMFLHEFLHGIGFSLSKNVDHKNIVYGAYLEKGIFYCMCKQLICKKNIMISLMFPLFFIGFVTLFIGFIFNIPVLIILSLFNIAGCIGDILMFFAFLRLPDFSYIDLDDSTGFVLVSDSDLSRYKLFGFNFCDSGDYDKLVCSSNFDKFTISKLSYIVFVFMIFILILSCFM